MIVYVTGPRELPVKRKTERRFLEAQAAVREIFPHSDIITPLNFLFRKGFRDLAVDSQALALDFMDSVGLVVGAAGWDADNLSRWEVELAKSKGITFVELKYLGGGEG